MSSENTSRSYNSTLREEQAANTRKRILDASAACFATSGFAGTSLRDIAATAGVSVETVKLNGPKSALLIAAFEQMFAGSEGRASIAERDAGQQVMRVADNDEFLEQLVSFIADANRRSSALWAAFVAAATADAAVGTVLDDLLSRRQHDLRGAIAELDRRGMIATDSPRPGLADALSFLLSPEGHRQLVTDAGWSHQRYTTWLVEAVRRLVLA